MVNLGSIVPTLALAAFLTVVAVLIFYVRRFGNLIQAESVQVGLEYWKNIIQICAGAAVALGILVSGYQLQLQSDQFIQRLRLETRQANNKEFYESAERLSKGDLSSTEASLVALRDLLSLDKGYSSSVKLILRATLEDLSAKQPKEKLGTQWHLHIRRITEQYLLLFDRACEQAPSLHANLSALRISQFDGRGLVADSVNFRRSALSDSNFTKAHLDCADFTEATLSNANFMEAKLRRAKLERAQLVEASFVQADLTGANLQGASLNAAKLTGAIMSCTNVRGANLGDADVDVYTLAEADFDAATELPKIITREQIEMERERRGIHLACR
jgi:hypothetical protein